MLPHRVSEMPSLVQGAPLLRLCTVRQRTHICADGNPE
jgi:hypothetical protein